MSHRSAGRGAGSLMRGGTCAAGHAFADEQLALGRTVHLPLDAELPDEWHIIVCVVDNSAWWRAAESLPGATRPASGELLAFRERLHSTLQVFHILLSRAKVPDVCAFLNLGDKPSDGAPSGSPYDSAPFLSSHRTSAIPQRPRVFLWPEFDYEGRLGSFMAPIPLMQQAAWGEAEVPWSRREETVHASAALDIYFERRRTARCARMLPEFRQVFRTQNINQNFRLRPDCAPSEGKLNASVWLPPEGGKLSAAPGGDCSPQGLPLYWRLDQFRRSRYNLFLPGQQDWSTSFSVVASLGAAVVAPSDLRSQSLWTSIVRSRCPDCMLWYKRPGFNFTMAEVRGNADNAICKRMLRAVRSANTTNASSSSASGDEPGPTTGAEATARRLSSFVQAELNEGCVYAYLARVLRGLRQSNATETKGYTRHRLRQLNFSAYSCRAQQSSALELIRSSVRLQRGNKGRAYFVLAHYAAWFDGSTCLRRERPLPLSWAPCHGQADGAAAGAAAQSRFRTEDHQRSKYDDFYAEHALRWC